MIHKKWNDEGVSEAIGFLIMFTIVLTGIAMVSLVGYPMLIETQVSSDERNMEQAMIAIQNDMKILTFSNVPYRDSMIKVSGGELTAFDKNSFGQEFTISDSYGLNNKYKPGAVQYESDDGTAVLTLTNGAIVRREKFQEGSVMLAEPRWFYDSEEKALVIFIISLNADKEFYQRGIGTVQMSMKQRPLTNNSNYIVDHGSPATVTVTYNDNPKDDYSAAWRNYLTGELGFTENPVGSNNYELNDVQRLVIKEYNIKVENM